MSSTTSLTNFFLVKDNGELVVREGVNPNAGKHADKRVLIIGGGVTGLTVSIERRNRAKHPLTIFVRTHGLSSMLGTQ